MTRPGRAGLILAAGLALLGTACNGGSAKQTSANYTHANLPRLVLSRSDAPPGAQPVSSPKTQSLAQVVGGDRNAADEERALSADGFAGAYQASFVSPNVPAAGGAALFRLTTSAAALFPNTAAAAQAVQVFATTAKQGPGVSRLDATSLAPDAVGLVTSSSTVIGDDYAFIWSTGRLALVVIVATDTTTQNVAPPLAVAAELARRVAAMAPMQSDDVTKGVLQPSQSPAGTQYVANRSGPRTASQLAGQASEATQLTQLGYQAGYQTLFAASGLPVAGGGQAGAAFIASFAQLYSSAGGAEHAYQMQISGRLRLLGNGLQAVPAQIGDQSAGFSFKTTEGTSTVPGVLIAWRRANAVLAVYAFGPAGTVSASKVRQLAGRVDQRASAIGK